MYRVYTIKSSIADPITSGLPVLIKVVRSDVKDQNIGREALDNVEVPGLNIRNFPTADAIQENTGRIDYIKMVVGSRVEARHEIVLETLHKRMA